MSRIPIGLDYHSIANNNNHRWGKKLSPLSQEKILINIKGKSKPFYNREIKMYGNYHFQLQNKDRQDAFNNINKELVFYEKNPVKRKISWENQINYSFVISPHGIGLDCHRTWEALILGCIPIVKTSKIDKLFSELPVLIVTEWKDINIELLKNTIEDFKNKNFNYDKITLKYWINFIKNNN